MNPRLLPLLAVLLGVLPALAAPVPKAIKRDPLLGEWVADRRFELGATDYDEFRFGRDTLTLSGGDSREPRDVEYETEEDPDGERFLVLLNVGIAPRRYSFVCDGGTLTVRDRPCKEVFVLTRGR